MERLKILFLAGMLFLAMPWAGMTSASPTTPLKLDRGGYWTPNKTEVANLEKRIGHLPNGERLQSRARFYTGMRSAGRRIIVGSAMEVTLANVQWTMSGGTVRPVPLDQMTVQRPSSARIVAGRYIIPAKDGTFNPDMPWFQGGGCSMVAIYYDPTKGRLLNLECSASR